MATLLAEPASRNFAGFGPSILVQQLRGRQKRVLIPKDRLACRKLLREKCPLVPGVYGWLDANRQLVYVGKSKSLRKRLLSYFAKNPSDHKMERIRQDSLEIVWEPISHELPALIREQELIHRWRPDFNSQGQPTRMQPAFLCIAGSPAPNARLARRLNGKFLHAFGPISGTNYLRQAIASFNQVFRLRDCADKTKFEFQSQKMLFDNPVTAKCIRHELGTCPGPCAAMCSANTYSQLLDKALGFLRGDSQETLLEIERKMQAAAEKTAFETAAIYRDFLDNMTWLDRRLGGLRQAEQHLNGVLEMEARRNRTAWIILRAGRIVTTMAKPDTPRRAEQAAMRISSCLKSTPDLPESLLEMSLQLIVISWFRKYPEIKQHTLGFEQAEEFCGKLSTRRDKVAA